MPEAPFTGEIEVVLGRLTSERAEAVLRFLTERAGFSDADAGDELDRVVCLAVARTGEVVGLASAGPATLPMVGGVDLWLQRSVTAPEAEDALVNACFDTLEETYRPEGEGPLGLCQVIRSRDRVSRDAVCPRTGLLHAGFLEDGSQVRIRFFGQASIGPRLTPLPPVAERARPPQLDERHRIEAVEESGVGPDDILGLWTREDALPAAVAQRRVHEVDLVAIDEHDGLVGVCSSYLQHSSRLRMDLRAFRAFVAQEHRRSSLAFTLALRGRDHWEGRYMSGEDTRAAGLLYEVESDVLKRYRNEAHWAATDFTYIGENDLGAHLRVHYFPGVQITFPD